MDLTYIGYLSGGIVMLVFSAYLAIYYFAHSKKVINGNGSKYFRRLSYLFFPPLYFGFVYVSSGLLSLIGVRDWVIPFIPLLTSLGIILWIIVLTKFYLATNEE